jgi:hypothetical protein
VQPKPDPHRLPGGRAVGVQDWRSAPKKNWVLGLGRVWVLINQMGMGISQMGMGISQWVLARWVWVLANAWALARWLRFYLLFGDEYNLSAPRSGAH